MKWHSPILFLFLLATCCREKEVSPAIDKQAKLAWSITPADSAIAYLNKITNKAYASQNEQAIYTALSWKANYLVDFLPDSLPATLKELKKSVKRRGTSASLAFYESKMGDYYLHMHSYDSAFHYFNASTKQLQRAETDSVTAAYDLMKLAEILQVYDDYRGAESTATEALAILKDRNTSILKELNNTLAISFSGVKDYKSAIEYYRRAAVLAADSLSKDIIAHNIAYTYSLIGHHDKAIKMLSQLADSPSIKSDPFYNAMVLDNLGYALFKDGDKKGIPLMQQSLEMAMEGNFAESLPGIYLHLSEVYQTEKPAQSIAYAQKAYNSASQIQSVDNRINALQKLAMLTEGKQSKQYMNAHMRLSDSINDVRIRARNQYAKLRYDHSDATKEKIQSENKRWIQLIVSIAVITLFLVTGVFLFLLLRSRHKKEKLKTAYRMERQFAKKVHDELSNDIFHTIALAETADLTKPYARENLLDKLSRIYTTTRNISRENSAIDTGEGFPKQLLELLSSYQSDAISVYQSGLDKVDWAALADYKKTSVYRIIQELLTNMKKHSQCSRAIFSFGQKDNHICIGYKDDGVGMGSHPKKDKNGLLNAENRIRELRGTFTFDIGNDKGFGLSFTIPLKK